MPQTTIAGQYLHSDQYDRYAIKCATRSPPNNGSALKSEKLEIRKTIVNAVILYHQITVMISIFIS